MQRTFGHGRISTKLSAGRSRIDRLYQEGAARIRVPDHPGRAGLEAVIINTAGGVTGGDDLRWQAHAGAGTHLTVTTQACEKVYKAGGSSARVDVELKVEAGATLHWLPQETILFNQARLQRGIHAELADDARLLLVEPVILGRRAMKEAVLDALWHDRWTIRQSGALIHGEAVRLEGDIAQTLNSMAGLYGHTALATLLLLGKHGEAKLDGARAILAASRDCVGGASCWQVGDASKLVVRLAARHGYGLRKTLIPLINHLAGESPRAAELPRIWTL